jgi:hypothetical protein
MCNQRSYHFFIGLLLHCVNLSIACNMDTNQTYADEQYQYIFNFLHHFIYLGLKTYNSRLDNYLVSI